MKHNSILVMLGVTLLAAFCTTGFAAAQNLEEATAVYEKAVAVRDSSRSAAITLFEQAREMADELGDKGAALAAQCKEILPKLYLEFGTEWATAGEFDKAIKALNQAVEYGEEESSPKILSDIYITKAVACQQVKDWKGALENAQKSVQSLDNPMAEKIVGLSAFSLKQNKVAAEAWEAYLSMAPEAIEKEAGIVYNLGLALVATGESDKACGYFRQIAQDADFGMAARYQIVTLKCTP